MRRGPGSWEEDPGWPVDWRWLVGMLPFVGPLLLRRRLRAQEGDALRYLRSLFMSFNAALVAFALVLVFIGDLPDGPVVPWLPLLFGIAVVVLAIPTVGARPLDCESDAKLASSYRARFFLRLAFGESVALFAFVFTFIGGPRWIYDVGLVVTLSYFWSRVAPTRRALVREQHALQSQGCGRSLVRALRMAAGNAE